jgi:hypothetical protein
MAGDTNTVVGTNMAGVTNAVGDTNMAGATSTAEDTNTERVTYVGPHGRGVQVPTRLFGRPVG